MWLDDYLIVIPMAGEIFYCISPWVVPSFMPGRCRELCDVLYHIMIIITDPRTTPIFNLGNVWLLLMLCFAIVW